MHRSNCNTNLKIQVGHSLRLLLIRYLNLPMDSKELKNKGQGQHTAMQLLWFWTGWHLVVWTLVPLVCNTCLPLDCMEAVLWGSEWEWGYDKHPPLSGWMAELFSERMGDAGVYLLSQLCVVSAGWGIFRLGLCSSWM